MSIPFLHPALLGAFLVAGLVVAALAPSRLRRWWVMLACGAGAVLAMVFVGGVPWIGRLRFSAYGVCLLFAYLIAYGMVVVRARHLGLGERQVVDMALIALIAGLLGARFMEVVDHWSAFTSEQGRPLPVGRIIARIVDIDEGGMVMYGGAILGTLSVAIYAWRRRIPLLPLADLVAPAVLAALAMGRVGCWFNGCCFGARCSEDLPWAVLARPGPHWRHPAQLYEVVVAGLLAALCWWWWRRRRCDGQVVFMACIGYGAWRIINEGLREDKVMTTLWGVWPASTAQVISVHLLLATVIGAVIVHVRRKRRPDLAWQARRVPGSIRAPVEPVSQP